MQTLIRYFGLFGVVCFCGVGAFSGDVSRDGTDNTPVSYPGAQKLTCLSMPQTPITDAAYDAGRDLARAAVSKPYNDPAGIWDVGYLKTHPKFVKLVEAFLAGERGASVKNLKLAGKKGSEIHHLLMAGGFHFDRKPLSVYGDGAERLYWRADGTKTSNPKDPSGSFIDIYWHDDGGLVRVKPAGIPNRKASMPEPHVSKAVLWTTKKQMSKKNRGDRPVHVNTGFRNEAFKVSESGIPLPKSPFYKSGIRSLYKRDEIKIGSLNHDAKRLEQRGWTDAIMKEAHLALPADFSACPVQNKQNPKGHL